MREICRPASPAPPAVREIVRPAHEKWLKMGVLWRAGRTSSRKCRWRGCVGRVFSRNCCGMVRWASFSRNRRPSWWACGAAAVAAAAPHQLGTNFACNSPTTLSMFEISSLKSRGFYRGRQRPREGIACEIEDATQNQSTQYNAAVDTPRADQCHSALPTAQVPSSCSTRVRNTSSWTGSCESSA